MEETENKKTLEESIEEAKRKVKQEIEYYTAQKKAAFTWNIIFFIGIVGISSAVTIISNSSLFDANQFKNIVNQDRTALVTSFAGILLSFIIGTLSSYWKTKLRKNKSEFDIKLYLKNAYLTRIDKSILNPNR